MRDDTMHLQGWFKLMNPKPLSPRQRKLAAERRKVEQARWDKVADEAIAWARANLQSSSRDH